MPKRMHGVESATRFYTKTKICDTIVINLEVILNHPIITTREGRGPSVHPRRHENLAHVSASLQYDSAGC